MPAPPPPAANSSLCVILSGVNTSQAYSYTPIPTSGTLTLNLNNLTCSVGSTVYATVYITTGSTSFNFNENNPVLSYTHSSTKLTGFYL